MQPNDRHLYPSHADFDGGDLDCGNGLLLLIRKHLDPLLPGQLLEIRSNESSVEEDLPSWARLTGNELLSFVRAGNVRSFLVCKGKFSGSRTESPPALANPAISIERESAAPSRPAEIKPIAP